MDFLCSFVHGYNDNTNPKGKLPCILVKQNGVISVKEFEFPRNPVEFDNTSLNLVGEYPLASSKNFDALPRFGLTGIARENSEFFLGSWNGVYQISASNFECKRFISHRLMNDIHGICVHEGLIYTVLTGKDTLVCTSLDGDIVNTYHISNDLKVTVDEPSILQHDWRFISKQFRGATGKFHFNYVQVIEGEIWLTSRNLGCFIVLNPKSATAHMRTINQKTVVLLHDGKLMNGAFYFTSIDGKILISSEQEAHNPREIFEDVALFDRDLNSKIIRLEQTELGRQPNWCRGIDLKDEKLAVTIDGLYGSDLAFRVLILNEEGRVFDLTEIRWSEIGVEGNLKYVTGFDVEFI